MAETFAVKLKRNVTFPIHGSRQPPGHPITPGRTRSSCATRTPSGTGIARELIWFEPWDLVMEWNYPYAKWFVNGKLNITYNCLDRHVTSERKDKPAIIWRGEQGRGTEAYLRRPLPRGNAVRKRSSAPRGQEG